MFSSLLGGSPSAIFHRHKDRMIECGTPPVEDPAAHCIAPVRLGARALFAHCQNCQHLEGVSCIRPINPNPPQNSHIHAQKQPSSVTRTERRKKRIPPLPS